MSRPLWAVVMFVIAAAAVMRRRESLEAQAADVDAVRRVAGGAGEALAELYDRHSRPVYSLALRVLGDQSDAEDVTQDVFTQAWRQASRYDAARGAVGAWLLNMARSRAIDRLRARRGQPAATIDATPLLASLPDGGPAPDVVADSIDSASRVRSALNDLPLVQRLAIELAYFEGLSHSEIAERLEQPLGTVKTRIRLGLLRLRDALTGAA